MRDLAITLLLIEDDLADARLIRTLLAEVNAAEPALLHTKLHEASTLAAGLERLAAGDIQLTLLDLTLPDSDGSAAFTQVLQSYPNVPLIVLTGVTDDALAVSAVRAGAQDYLSKTGLSGPLLARAIRYAVERQHILTELLQSEQRFRALVENVSDIILVLNPDRTIRYASPAVERLTGHPPATWEGQDLLRILAPEEQEPLALLFNHLLQHPGLTLPVSARLAHGSTWRTVEGVAHNLLADPAVDGIILSLHDVTRRVQAEVALAHSRDFYLTLFNHLPTLIWRSGPDAKCTYVNQTALAFTGRSSEAVRGDGWLSDLHPQDQQRCLETYLEAFLARQPYTIEYRLRRHDGQYRHVLEVGQPYADMDGLFAGYLRSAYDITERYQAEELQAFLAAIVTSSDNAIIGKTLAGEIRSWNAGAERIYGYSAAEAIGRPVTMLLAPDRPAEVQQILARIRQGERVEHYETVRRRKDGTAVIVSLTTSPIYNAAGEIVGASTIAHDITARRQMEQALHESEARFRSIVEQLHDGIVITNPEGRVLEWNPGEEQLTGIPRDEAIGRYIWELQWQLATEERRAILTYESYVAKVKEFYTQEQVTWPTQPQEAVIRHRDGSQRIIQTLIFPLLTAQGLGVGSVSHDITAQKKAEQALRESEELYRKLVSTSPDGIVLTDLEGAILYLSPRTLALFNATQAEGALGHNVLEWISPEDRPRAAADLQAVSQTPRVGQTYTLVRRDGSRFYGEITAAAVLDATGRPYRIISTVRDVTERVHREAALRASEAQLRSMIDQSHDSIILCDEQGLIVEWNRAQEQLSGLPRARALGRYAWDVMFEMASSEMRTPEAYTRLKADFMATLATGRPPWSEPLHEQLIQRPDGSRRSAELRVFPIRTDSGFMICSISRDITERKRAEEAWRESEARFRSLFEHSPLALGQYDAEGRLLAMNPAGLRLFGATDLAAAQATLPLAALNVPPAALQQGQPVRYEMALEIGQAQGPGLPTAPGKLSRLDVQITPLTGPDRGYLVQIQDVTEQRAVEEQVWFQAHLLDKVQEAIIATDLQGRIIYWNRATETLYGWSAAELLHRDVAELIVPHHETARLRAVLKQLAQGGTWSGEIHIRRKEGSPVLVLLTAGPLDNEAGQQIGIISLATDISKYPREE